MAIIDVKASTLQRVLDLLPSKTGLNEQIDKFLTDIHTKGGDVLTELSRSEDPKDLISIHIRVRK